jgi:hypothetical protein
MKIRNLALAALLLSSIGAVSGAQSVVAAAASGDPYQATVTKIVKLVEWQRYRTTRWQKASIDNLLLVGDTLRTGTDAKAELLYGDGSVTRVGSLTSLTLTGDNKRELHLDSGRVWLHIQKGGAGMRVITPGAVAAVTGTELMVEFDAAKKLTEVTVFEGSVNVSSDVGNLVRVIGGTTTMVPFNAPAAAPVPLDTRKLQERENIFRPLSVKDSGTSSQNNGNNGTPAATPEPKATDKPSDSSQGQNGTEHATATPAPATNPDKPADTTANTGTTSTNGTPADAGNPQTNPATTGKTPVEPDLKGQTQKMGDPRLIGGSPTTGTLEVIIK